MGLTRVVVPFVVDQEYLMLITARNAPYKRKMWVHFLQSLWFSLWFRPPHLTNFPFARVPNEIVFIIIFCLVHFMLMWLGFPASYHSVLYQPPAIITASRFCCGLFMKQIRLTWLAAITTQWKCLYIWPGQHIKWCQPTVRGGQMCTHAYCILLCEPIDYSTKLTLMGLNEVDYIFG